MTPEPAWLTEARTHIGTKEVAGPGNNPAILGWVKELGGWEASFYKADEIPWCGLFVAICFKRVGIAAVKGFLGAQNWATWGVHVAQPVPGTVLVFKRPGGGHVAFYVGEDEECYHTLGGNQSDSVDIARIPKSRLVAARWPANVGLYGSPVHLTANGQAASKDEA